MHLQNDKTLKIPGKTFIFGEYAALKGGAALIMAHRPSFDFKISDSQDCFNFHPDSPAGKYLRERKSPVHLQMQNPYGRGGIGTSTAEFIAAWFFSERKSGGWNQSGISDALQEYRKLFLDRDLQPSGYDLLAQMSGGFCRIDDFKVQTNEDWFLKEHDLLLFHSPEKLTTHSHLDAIKQIDFTELLDTAKFTSNAWIEKNEILFLSHLDKFSLALVNQNLVASKTKEVINDLKRFKFVRVVKGCGAMGADTILLIVTKGFKSQAIKESESLGLKFFADQQDVFLEDLIV